MSLESKRFTTTELTLNHLKRTLPSQISNSILLCDAIYLDDWDVFDLEKARRLIAQYNFSSESWLGQISSSIEGKPAALLHPFFTAYDRGLRLHERPAKTFLIVQSALWLPKNPFLENTILPWSVPKPTSHVSRERTVPRIAARDAPASALVPTNTPMAPVEAMTKLGETYMRRPFVADLQYAAPRPHKLGRPWSARFGQAFAGLIAASIIIVLALPQQKLATPASLQTPWTRGTASISPLVSTPSGAPKQFPSFAREQPQNPLVKLVNLKGEEPATRDTMDFAPSSPTSELSVHHPSQTSARSALGIPRTSRPLLTADHITSSIKSQSAKKHKKALVRAAEALKRDRSNIATLELPDVLKPR